MLLSISSSKMLYKTENNETQHKLKINQSPSKNDLLKTTLSQRHNKYYGFVKTSFEEKIIGTR